MKIIKTTLLSKEEIKIMAISLAIDLRTLPPDEFNEKYVDIEMPEACITYCDAKSDTSVLHDLVNGYCKNDRKNRKAFFLLCKTYGVNVNVGNSRGMTPLHLAVNAEKSEITTLLLTAGANPDYRDKSGMSPLHLAVINNDLGITTDLVKAGANPNAESAYGKTPLHFAFCNTSGNESSRGLMAELLIQHGAKITPIIMQECKYDSVLAAILREKQEQEIQELKAQVNKLIAASEEKQQVTVSPFLSNNTFRK
jgi:hypothetical protein